MPLVLKRSQNRIKNGWESRSAIMRIAAHGHSPEVADRNLERVARMFFTSLEREGRLEQEARRVGIETEGEGGELQVLLIEG